jgi:hypothetical protein
MLSEAWRIRRAFFISIFLNIHKWSDPASQISFCISLYSLVEYIVIARESWPPTIMKILNF